MPDIFEIMGVNAQLKVGPRSFDFKDPKFSEKIAVMKLMKENDAKREGMDQIDQFEMDREWQKKYIQLYIPSMDDKYLDEELGDVAFKALVDQVTQLARDKFGAYVQMIGDPKKAKATTTTP